MRRLRHYVPANPTGPTRVLSEVSFAARALASGVRRPDIVITVSPALLPVLSARVVAKRWGVPLGVVVQDLYSRAMVEVGLLGDRSGGPATRLESFALKGADGLVAIHERFAQTMVDSLGVDPDRITVIPNWTHVQPPTGDRDETRRRLGWGSETVVLHAGNMGAKQGLEHVVDAAALADRSDDRLRVVLMGNGNQRSDLERRAQGSQASTSSTACLTASSRMCWRPPMCCSCTSAQASWRCACHPNSRRTSQQDVRCWPRRAHKVPRPTRFRRQEPGSWSSPATPRRSSKPCAR